MQPDNTKCAAAIYITPTTIESGTQCQAPPAVKFIAACIHEHVDKGLFCAWHNLEFVNNGTLCNTCYQAGCHGCTFRYEIYPL